MPPCTELHIPYKKWALGAGLANPQQLEQNFNRIEDWAAKQTCGGGGTAPKSWCGSAGSYELEPGEDSGSLGYLDTSGRNPDCDYFFVTATCRFSADSAGDVGVVANFYGWDENTSSYGQLSDGARVEDFPMAWPGSGSRTYAFSCTIAAGDRAGVRLTNSGSSTVNVYGSWHLVVIELLDHVTDAACCIIPPV